MNLSEYTTTWSNAPMAKPTGNDLPPLPDDTYNVILKQGGIKASKRTGDPMIALAFEVVAGAYKGRWIWKNSLLSMDERRMAYLKRDLAYLGVDTRGPIESLDEQLGDCLGCEITVDLKTKRGNDGVDRQNVYLNPPASWSEPAADDEIPF